MIIKTLFLMLVGVAAILLPQCGAMAQMPLAEQRFEASKRAIVKIVAEGKNPDGNWRKIDGSGFYVYSKGKITFLVTAAHVVGSNETEQSRNPDWLIENGTISRTIKISSLDEQGSLILRSDAAQVVPVVIGVDIAILAIVDQDGYPILTLPEQLTEKIGVHTLILMGFQSGKSSLTALLRVATGRLTSPSAFTTSDPSREGESGGAWIDVESGKVFAVASGLRNQPSSPSYVATPVTYAKDALQNLYSAAGVTPPRESENSALRVLSRTGEVAVSVFGDKGALASRPSKAGALDEDFEVSARGDESSQCDAGSGRTFSEALARARIISIGGNGLFFDYDIRAQGGHYRTAATCLGGVPVGLTGNDTSAIGDVRLKGEMEFNARTNDRIRLVWRGMPLQGASFRLFNTTNSRSISPQNNPMNADDEQSVQIPSGGRIRLIVNIDRTVRNTGACCPERIKASGSVTIEQ